MNDKVGASRPNPLPAPVSTTPTRSTSTPSAAPTTAAPRPAAIPIADAHVDPMPARKAPVALQTNSQVALSGSAQDAGRLFQEQISRSAPLGRIKASESNTAQAKDLFSFLAKVPVSKPDVGSKDVGSKDVGSKDVGTKDAVGLGVEASGELGSKPPDVTAAQALAQVTAQKGFQALPANQQFAVTRLINDDSAPWIRSELASTVSSPDFAKKSPADQAEALRSVITGNLPANERELTEEPATSQVQISKPKTENGQDIYSVTVKGKTIPVSMPHLDPPSASVTPVFGDRTNHSIQTVAKALSELAPETLALVTQVNLSGVQNPDDAYWAKQYNMPDFQSYMTCGAEGIVSIYPITGGEQPQGDISEVLMHESGHAWSKARWGDDTSGADWKPWRDAAAKDGIEVSTYAQSSMDEDVAETSALYLASRGTPKFDQFRQMFPARFAVLDQVFSQKATA